MLLPIQILEIGVSWSLASLRGDPSNNLIWIGDVAGLAVNAVRGVKLQFHLAFTMGVIHHRIDRRRTEMLAGVAVFFGAPVVADIKVCYDQMRWLWALR